MKSLTLIFSLVLLYGKVNAKDDNIIILTNEKANKIADAIYRLEGGINAKVPYGILSIKVNNKEEARKICINTVKNNYIRWQKQTKEKDFLNFLADRYCPSSVDYLGNINWKKNIHKFMK